MGAPTDASAPIAGQATSEAQARSFARQAKGELVHISDAQGDVRVQRAGRFDWETVGPEGLTVHQGAKIKTARGGRATVTSQSRGEKKMGGGQFLEASEVSATAGPKQKLQWGTPVKAKKDPVPPASARPRRRLEYRYITGN